MSNTVDVAIEQWIGEDIRMELVSRWAYAQSRSI